MTSRSIQRGNVPFSLPRRNQIPGAAEQFRPPPFPPDAGRQTVAIRVRRFLDLQAGSIYRDLERLLPQATGTVVDVGAGAEPYRGLVRPQVHYIGIDTADAKAHFGYEMPEIRYFQGTIWPVGDGEADLVLCAETLEHVAEPRPFLAEAWRVLGPGGHLLLTVPFAARWHFIPHDYWRFTPSGLERLLGEVGFTDIAVYARGDALTVACYKAMALIIPLLLPSSAGMVPQLVRRLAGIALLPALGLLAVIGNLSLLGDGGDDCLGYTVLARRPEAPTHAS